jgi:polyhydroxybutyrate depolymerase
MLDEAPDTGEMQGMRAAVLLLPLVCLACGGGPETPPGWQGTPSDAGRPDALDLNSAYPTADPDPDAGSAGSPTFGDAGAPPGPFACAPAKGGAKGDRILALTSKGLPRTSLLHVPQGYAPSTGAMLVLSFHGFAMDAPTQQLISRMNKASDAKGFVVAYPQGVVRSWNAGDCCGTAWTDSVDDVAFVDDLLAKIEAEYCIDPKRVYATGFSNGGFLSHRLGCERANVFAAIAPVAGVMGMDPKRCNPSRPMPVIDFHGSSDPVVPYNGGMPFLPVIDLGVVDFRSVGDTLAAWKQKNACLGSPQTIYAKGDATCTRVDGCAQGADVVHCRIDGGGHTWPGGVPIPLAGKTSTDISATDTMIGFFEAHPMP